LVVVDEMIPELLRFVICNCLNSKLPHWARARCVFESYAALADIDGGV
jgi:hypothetical protein